jgi:GNAT superfamily N-acetyltransferase
VTLLTGGLLETERNKGLGAKLFIDLIDMAKEKFDQPVGLEVLKANHRACKLYTNLGFKPIYSTERIFYMELD